MSMGKGMKVSSKRGIAVVVAVSLVGAAAAFAVHLLPLVGEKKIYAAAPAAFGAVSAQAASTPVVVGPLRVGAWYPVDTGNTDIPIVSISVSGIDGVVRASTREGWIFRSSDDAATWQVDLHWPRHAPDADLKLRQHEVVRTPDDKLHHLTVNDNGYVQVSHDGWQTSTTPLMREVNRLKVVNRKVYALLTDNDVYVSADGGATWATLPGFGAKPSELKCHDVVETNRGAVVLCANSSFYVQNPTTPGENWGLLPTIIPGVSPRGARLAASLTSPTTVYAAYTSSDYEVSAGVYLFRSMDGGRTWVERSRPQSGFNRYVLGDFETECKTPRAGAAEFVLAVDKIDPERLWIGARDLYRSDDGGLTFGRASVYASPPASGRRIAPGISQIAFPFNYDAINNKAVYVTTDDGVYRGDDARGVLQQTIPNSNNCSVSDAPQIRWERRMQGFNGQAFVQAQVRPDGELLASVEGRGGLGSLLYGEIDRAESWQRMLRVAPTQAVIDPILGMDRLYINGCRISQACRLDWNPYYNYWDVIMMAMGEVPDASVLIADPASPQRLRAAVGNKLFVTADSGYNWSATTTAPYAITAAAFAPHRPDLVVVGDAMGNLWNSFYAQEPSFGLSGTQYNDYRKVTGVMFDPRRPERIYATRAGAPSVLVSQNANDGWIGWTAIDRPGDTDGLPERGAYALAIDPSNDDIQYLGTDDGLFVRGLKVGTEWLQIPTPFANARIRKLVFRPQADGSRTLYAFTEGRGVWAMRTELNVFGDVSFNDWSYDYIQRLYAAGLTNGCRQAPLSYCGQDPVLREQMAVFLLRAKFGKYYAPPAAASSYWDVPSDHWGVNWIEALKAQGLTNGCSQVQPLYCPGAAVPREQMAVFLLRTKHGTAYVPPPAVGQFEDVPASHWAAPWIEQLAREGITTGCSVSPARFCPSEPVTREQVAAFLVRAFGI